MDKVKLIIIDTMEHNSKEINSIYNKQENGISKSSSSLYDNLSQNAIENTIIEGMKEIGLEENIDETVFDLLKDQNFKDFINTTFISGGSSILKGKKVEEIHIIASKNIAQKLNLNTKQKFLNIIGLSGSGKSEIRKKLPRDILYFPLDEKLKPFLNMNGIKELDIFKTNNKFDAKKFEYAMYCAAFMSGKYNNYIIDHSGGSPLQPGLQALSEVLAGEYNKAIHLKVQNEVIANNIAHNILYDNWHSVKEPVRDAIGIELGYVKNGYEKEDPAREQLVKHEMDENDILGNLRKRYKDFCDKNNKLNSTTAKINAFMDSLKKNNLYQDLELLNIHKIKAMDYVKSNEWRKPQFDSFNSRTQQCSSVIMAARLVKNYLSNLKNYNTLIEGIPTDIPQFENLAPLEKDIDVYLFDMHGVIHSGGEIQEETLEYLKYLKNSGKKVIIASNDVDCGDKYISNIKNKGLIQGEHFDFAITSGDVLNQMLKTGEIEKIIKSKTNIQNRKIRIFVQDDLKSSIIFNGENSNKFEQTFNIEEADAVITGTPKDEQSHERIAIENKSSYLTLTRNSVLNTVLKKQLPIIVPNPDRRTPFENNTQTIGAGRFAKICSKSNHNIIMTGKPSEHFYNYLKDRLTLENIEYNPSRVAMIGDSFATDIVGGNQAGFKTIAVVNEKSNIGIVLNKNKQSFLERIYNQPEARPTIVVKSI